MAAEVTDPKAEQPKDQPDAKPVDPMRVLARRAVEIAEAGGASLGSAITAPQAERVVELFGDQSPLERFSPATRAQLTAYAQGGKLQGRAEIPKEAIDKIRTFCRESGSRRIWPRKVAALSLAIEELRKAKAN